MVAGEDLEAAAPGAEQPEVRRALFAVVVSVVNPVVSAVKSMDDTSVLS